MIAICSWRWAMCWFYSNPGLSCPRHDSLTAAIIALLGVWMRPFQMERQSDIYLTWLTPLCLYLHFVPVCSNIRLLTYSDQTFITVSHLTKCNKNSKVRVSLTNYPHPFLQVALHLTQPHPHARKHKHGRILTVWPWTTTDEFNIIPKTQQMSSTSFPGHQDILTSLFILFWLTHLEFK